MADIEKKLLSRIVFKGEIQRVLDRKIEAKMVSDEEYREAFEFVLEFYHKYGELPSIDLMEEQFPDLKLMYTKEPIDYCIDELLKLYVRNKSSSILMSNARLLVTDPLHGLEVLRSELVRLTVEANPTRDKDLIKMVDDRKKHYLKMKESGGVDGYPTPFEVLNTVTMGWHPGEFISIVARPAIGKSIQFLEKVETSGGRIPIKDVKPGMEVVTYNERAQKLEYGIVEALVDSGVKKEVKVRTRFGKTLGVSEEHPFLTPMGWKSVENGLKVGDQIAIPKWLPDVEDIEVPIEEVELLALMIADGGISSGVMTYSKKIDEMIEVARKLARYYGTELVGKGDGCSWYFKNGITNEARQVIKKYGLDGLRSYEKFIPDGVFRMKKGLKKRFIELLVSGDGSVMRNYIEYSSTSEGITRGLGNLLLRFGVKYQIRERQPWYTYKGERREGRKAWILTIRGDDAQKFMETFDVVEEKAKNFEGGVDDRNYVNIKLSEEQLDEIWEVFKGRLKELTVALGYKLQGEYQNKGYVSKGKLRGKGLSQKNCKMLYEQYGVESLRIASTDDLVFEEVMDIEICKPVQMYDLEVSNGHNFVAGDVLVHNTFLLVIFAEYAFKNNLNVLFINNEMSEEQIGKRFDAVHFRLPYKEFRAGLLPDEMEKRYFEGLDKLAKSGNPFWVISDVHGVTSIASKIDQYKPDIVMVDGLYLLNDDKGGSNRWERTSNISRDLKKLAQQKNVPVIATTQFNRAADEVRMDRVTLANIGFSDSLGMDSDVVLGLFRNRDMEMNNEMMIRMLKCREGQEIDFTLLWDLHAMRFEVLDTDDRNVFIEDDLDTEDIEF